MEELLRNSFLTADILKMLRSEAGKAKAVAELLGQDSAKLYYARALIPAVLHQLEDRQNVYQQKSMGTKQDGLRRLEETFAERFKEDTAPTGKLKALIERLQDLARTDYCQCLVFVKEVATTVPVATLLERHVKKKLPVCPAGVPCRTRCVKSI